MLYPRQKANFSPELVQLQYEDVVCDCKSCGQRSTFEYCGAQHFPVRATDDGRHPRTLYLFTCRACGSTLSHLDLDEVGAQPH